MSLRQWNSVAERVRLQRYVLLAEMMLEEEEVGDSSDDDSEASGGMDMEMEFIIDQELSFITDIDNNADEEGEGDEEHDTVDHVIRSTMAYSNFIYCPMLDGLIDFTRRPLKISDLDDSKDLLDFRFCKDDLQEIADSLWPKLEPFLEGTRNKSLSKTNTNVHMKPGCSLSCIDLPVPVAYVPN